MCRGIVLRGKDTQSLSLEELDPFTEGGAGGGSTVQGKSEGLTWSQGPWRSCWWSGECSIGFDIRKLLLIPQCPQRVGVPQEIEFCDGQ